MLGFLRIVNIYGSIFGAVLLILFYFLRSIDMPYQGNNLGYSSFWLGILLSVVILVITTSQKYSDEKKIFLLRLPLYFLLLATGLVFIELIFNN